MIYITNGSIVIEVIESWIYWSKNMIAILLKYICICLIFTFIFGLIVLDDTDRWYELIIKILIMPFIVIGSFIIVIIDDLKK